MVLCLYTATYTLVYLYTRLMLMLQKGCDIRLADLHFRPLCERQSLGDQIYEQLRDDIVYMRLLPGQMIYENEIAEQLNVSRTPVREAFRLLASEQLIEIQPQRGTRIALISERKVSETWFVREQLEKGAFGLAARSWQDNIDHKQDGLLDNLISEQEAAVNDQDLEQLLKLDEDFHKLIMQVAGNHTLLQVIFQMRAHINRVRFCRYRSQTT